MRSEPSILAESRELVGRGCSAVTGRVCPLRDRTGVSEAGVSVPDEVDKGVRCMVKSEPAEASNRSGEVPGKISNALTTDLCSFAPAVGRMTCVVGTGYDAETDGEGGRM
jgi:hypothetical protein